NRMIGAPICDSPLFARFAREWGAHDYMGVLAVDSDGRGLMISAPLPKDRPLSPSQRRQWTMLARHLAAATRLHRAIDGAGLDPCAQIDAHSGRMDVSFDTRGTGSLRTSAQRISRARRRKDLARAVSMWQVLCSGNWSLVRRANSTSGWFLAYENPPNAPDP